MFDALFDACVLRIITVELKPLLRNKFISAKLFHLNVTTASQLDHGHLLMLSQVGL